MKKVFLFLSANITLCVNAQANRDDYARLHHHIAMGNTVAARDILQKFDAQEINAPHFIGKKTALHLAARSGNDALVDHLLGQGADPNAQDIKGNTPLHTALHHGNTSTAAILQKQGAQNDITNEQGITPTQTIPAHGCSKCAQTSK